MDTDIRYIRISKKSFEKATGGMPDVNIPFWSQSSIFFEKKKSGSKNYFSNFFSESEVEELGFLRIFRKT